VKPNLTTLRQLRYLKRYRRILRVLIKHGFSQVLARLNLYGLRERLLIRRRREGAAPQNLEASLRTALEELGPAFIKVGQLLSTRTDLLPPSYVAELARLQDAVPPFPSRRAREIVEAELKSPIESRFASFEMEPLAAASLGQVHRAVLAGGEVVAIKIKRPGVDEQFRKDLDILVELAALVDRNTNMGPVYRFRLIVEELRQIILRELDYTTEARNAQRLRHNFSGSAHIYIPRVYWEHTTRNILTLEYRQGINISRYRQDPALLPPPDRVAEILADTFFKQVFVDGFFHGDLHPGNVAVLPDGKLFMMDFGSAGYISEELRGKFSIMIMAIKSVDTATVADELLRFTFVPPVLNRQELIRDIAVIQEQYYDLPLGSINLTEVIRKIMQVAVKHRLRFPYDFLLLAKAVATLEGTVSQLKPDFNLAAALQRYTPALRKRQIRYAARRFRGTLRSYHRLLEEIPERAVEILRETAAGELQFKVEPVNTGGALRILENMTNRLAFSIVLASLIIGLSQNLGQGQITWFGRVPLYEMALAVAGIAGIWWIFAIIRSGRL
jgi:ubiquinone biosynthesis protein